jgi:hypothetical protein
MPQTGPTITLPRNVYKHLVAAFAAHSAEWITRAIMKNQAQRDVMHPGDPFGAVLAWIWEDDPDQAMVFLADVMAMLRDHNLVAQLSPPVALDEFLSGLRLALPSAFTGYDQLVEKARREVESYYGGSLA